MSGRRWTVLLLVAAVMAAGCAEATDGAGPAEDDPAPVGYEEESVAETPEAEEGDDPDYASACIEGWFKKDCVEVDMAAIEDSIQVWLADEGVPSDAVRCPREKRELRGEQFLCVVDDAHGQFGMRVWWTDFDGGVEWGVCSETREHPELRKIDAWTRYFCD